MATIGIGPLILHTNQIGWQPARANAFSSVEVDGESYPAAITGPSGLELDLAVFMSESGQGMVHCPEPAGVPADYTRLGHGARLGVYVEEDGNWVVKQLRLLRFSSDTGWGNPTLTNQEELSSLLGCSAKDLLLSAGASEVGTKAEILGTTGKDLAIRWSPDAGPEVPLAAYAMTRVLPIFRALGQ